ncbi:MAG: ECF transporter S component [Halanaerobium sp.]
MNNNTRKLVWASILLALGILLPRLINLVGSVTLGNLISPMHIPVFLTALILGPIFGTIIGFITPLLSTLLTGMPPFSPPITILMAFELAAFALIAGYIYSRKGKNIYLALISAMIIGRIIYGFALLIIGPIFAFNPPFIPFMESVFITGIPGMIIQLVIIPPIIEKIKPIRSFAEFNRNLN